MMHQNFYIPRSRNEDAVKITWFTVLSVINVLFLTIKLPLLLFFLKRPIWLELFQVRLVLHTFGELLSQYFL